MQVLPISMLNGLSLLTNSSAFLFGSVAFVSMIAANVPIVTLGLEQIKEKILTVCTEGIHLVCLGRFGSVFSLGDCGEQNTFPLDFWILIPSRSRSHMFSCLCSLSSGQERHVHARMFIICTKAWVQLCMALLRRIGLRRQCVLHPGPSPCLPGGLHFSYVQYRATSSTMPVAA